MNEHDYAVIMAGGGGTRLWPLSRQETPKQMLRLAGERTMFQLAVDRLEGLFPPERILVVTVAEQAEKLRKQEPRIPYENYLLEPMPRGTASVVGLAAVAIQHRDPDGAMVVLTADHLIQEAEKFRTLLRSALAAARDDYLITLGIQPTAPVTGYGYIQRGEKAGSYMGGDAFRVLRFKEKPDEATAKRFVESGDHYWNSGMFIWKVGNILEEISRQMTQLSEILTPIAGSWGQSDQNNVLNSYWPEIKPETIDYGIMENAQRVIVLPAIDLGWSDIGSWDSLYDLLPTDERGNILIEADHYGLDTSSTLICSGEEKRLIVTIGVSDLVVVDTKDALLICSKDEAQKVKQVTNYLKNSSMEKLL
jgi:mannose-1-phosphate guanylyltransferase